MKRGISLFVFLASATLLQAAIGELKPVATSESALQQALFSAESKDFAKAAGGGIVNERAMVATLKARRAVIKVALDSKSPSAKALDLIRFDLSGKGNFQGQPTLPLKSRVGSGSGSAAIGPAKIQVQRDGKAIPVFVRGRYSKGRTYRYLYLQLGTGLEGSCAFGAKSRRVRILDGDGNFRCGDPVRLKHGKIRRMVLGDTLLVYRDSGRRVLQRVFFGQRVKVDGKWYEVKISPDGSKASAAKVELQTGQIRIPRGQWSATLVGTKHLLELPGRGEPIEVPSDQYAFMAYSERHGSGARVRCLAERGSESKAKVFDVPPGKVTDLAAGSPMTAALDVTSSGSQTSFSLRLVDASGIRVVDVRLANGQRPDAPRIKVYDAAGKRVYAGKMRYG